MSEISTYDGQPLPFEQLAKAIEQRSLYGRASGLRIDRAERGEAWASLPSTGTNSRLAIMYEKLKNYSWRSLI